LRNAPTPHASMDHHATMPHRATFLGACIADTCGYARVEERHQSDKAFELQACRSPARPETHQIPTTNAK